MLDEDKKLKNLLLSILVEVDRICRKHGINYSLCAGTLLGAVRHKGFIPWDDDIDIMMTRKEYDRFLKICEVELDSKKYFVQNEKTEKYYAFAFSKIQLKSTEIIEEFSKNVKIKHGIFIDILPYDNLPDNYFIRKYYLFKNHLYKNMLWIKCGYGTTQHKRKFSYKILKFLGKFTSLYKLKNRREKLLKKYNNVNTKYKFNSDYPNKIFLFDESYSEILFENKKFLCIKNYKQYLSLIYGDYMKLPPLEKREKHTQCKINFGIYSE